MYFKYSMSYLSKFEPIINQSKELFYTGKHRESLEIINQVLQLIEQQQSNVEEGHEQLMKLSQQLEQTSLSFAVSSIFLYSIDVSNTVSLLEDKLDQIEGGSSHYYAIMDLLGLALYYEQMSMDIKDFSHARKYFDEALEYRRKHNLDSISHSYFHLGLVNQYGGNAGTALDYFVKADNLADEQDDYLLKSFTTRHLGFMHQQAGDIQKATSLFEESLKLRLDHDILVYVPFSCITLADSYFSLDQNERAEQLYQQAITVAELINLDRGLALAYLSLARYYNKSDESIAAFLDSYYYAKKINHEGIMQFIRTQLIIKDN